MDVVKAAVFTGKICVIFSNDLQKQRKEKPSRGNDGPEGSVYRVNLRKGHENGRLVKYTFSGRGESTITNPSSRDLRKVRGYLV